MQKIRQMTKTLAHWYPSESTQQELPNEYQHEGVPMVFTNFCILMLWTKVGLALEEFTRLLSRFNVSIILWMAA